MVDSSQMCIGFDKRCIQHLGIYGVAESLYPIHGSESCATAVKEENWRDATFTMCFSASLSPYCQIP